MPCSSIPSLQDMSLQSEHSYNLSFASAEPDIISFAFESVSLPVKW